MFRYRVPCAISSRMNGVYILKGGRIAIHVRRRIMVQQCGIYNSHSAHINVAIVTVFRVMRKYRIAAILKFEFKLNFLFRLFSPLLFSFRLGGMLWLFPEIGCTVYRIGWEREYIRKALIPETIFSLACLYV